MAKIRGTENRQGNMKSGEKWESVSLRIKPMNMKVSQFFSIKDLTKIITCAPVISSFKLLREGIKKLSIFAIHPLFFTLIT